MVSDRENRFAMTLSYIRELVRDAMNAENQSIYTDQLFFGDIYHEIAKIWFDLESSLVEYEHGK